ncbi:acylphosphatase [Pelobacter seleniigenes]|uniref:acylphosphatase n=1 Tax=Pelobacter seleniigenes TaxID=407188 RepID=UPI0004A7063B|nr:acylphosphatase [Pelobacter seleniigenes]
MPQTRAEVIISGRVQGVGFRYSTFRVAQRNGLTGWCRNNPDHTVAAVFEGEQEALEAMLEWCRRGPALARVDDVQVRWGEATGEFSTFSIEP